MTARKSLADLASAFNNYASNGTAAPTWKKFFPFWKAPVGSTSIVRFLPDANTDNPMGFLVEHLTHELQVNGKREKVACLRMHDQECPICKHSAEVYKDNEYEGKKYYKKKSYIGQVLVLETPIEHDVTQKVKLIEFGPAVFKVIQAAFASGDMDEPPYEYKNGYNFRIKKSENGEYASYSTSSFSPKPTNVDPILVESLELYNLADYRVPPVSKEILETMLLVDRA